MISHGPQQIYFLQSRHGRKREKIKENESSKKRYKELRGVAEGIGKDELREYLQGLFGFTTSVVSITRALCSSTVIKNPLYRFS